MATPPSDETRTLFKLLLDREWHRYEDIHTALAATVPPGKALRRYENRLSASRGLRGDQKTEILLTETEQIDFGQRGIAQATISSWKGRGIIQRGEGRDKEIKIKPGFQTWGLDDAVPQAAESGPQAAGQDPPKEAQGYTEVPPSDSEPSDATRTTREWPPPSAAGPPQEILPAEGGSFRPPVEPLPRRQPNNAWVPRDEAHYAWPGSAPEVKGAEAIQSCVECGLAVIDMEIHEDWHASQSSAMSHQVRISFDEATEQGVADRVQAVLDPLLDQALSRALDRFQRGMQEYLENRFAQLEASLIALRTAVKQPDRWH